MERVGTRTTEGNAKRWQSVVGERREDATRHGRDNVAREAKTETEEKRCEERREEK